MSPVSRCRKCGLTWPKRPDGCSEPRGALHDDELVDDGAFQRAGDDASLRRRVLGAISVHIAPEGTTPQEAERLVKEQFAPVPNTSTPVWDLVVADMQARDRIGRERYGTPLQAGNGRDALVDAYQEALDLVVYLRQAIAERDTPKDR